MDLGHITNWLSVYDYTLHMRIGMWEEVNTLSIEDLKYQVNTPRPFSTY